MISEFTEHLTNGWQQFFTLFVTLIGTGQLIDLVRIERMISFACCRRRTPGRGKSRIVWAFDSAAGINFR